MKKLVIITVLALALAVPAWAEHNNASEHGNKMQELRAQLEHWRQNFSFRTATSSPRKDDDSNEQGNNQGENEHNGTSTIKRGGGQMIDTARLLQIFNALRQICAKVPPGHLIAPGWLRKNVAPVPPVCQILPPGILRLLGLGGPGGNGTTTPDIIPPVITNVMATSTMATSTHIAWLTNEPATSVVWYSTSTPVVATSPTPMASIAGLVMNHNVTLAPLATSTTYYFTVSSADAAGNLATSSQSNFATPSSTP